jgi:WD40 repeat protein
MVPHPSVEQIFHEAREIKPGGAREAYLRGVCGIDIELRSKVEALLRAEALAGDFLQRTEPFEKAPPAGGSAEQAGDLIGRYKLLQQIGEGGFGTVWMAEQREPVRRRVALKIIKLGMDTRQVIARFEAERQALAMMDHPNIAKVFDAGATDSGRPYFVMELVAGIQIVEYCDTEALDTRARLGLFEQVCRAIEHAHQKGVIHRDIKPSNVLVTLHDGRPVPRVIDFGIAKATDAELTEKTYFTEHRQMIGTPAYMSPEQADMPGLDIDTRSDIYSLGVLLYELLTGETPFDAGQLLSKGFVEMMRIIREVDPPKPSTRLSTARRGAVGPRRGGDPRRLGAMVRGDLDWIVMKCLEKDRRRRYPTADGLAADVRRYLAGDAVSAAPPGVAYRARKFVRRHRSAVVGASAFTAALLLGLSVAVAGFVDASTQRDLARGAARDAVAAKGLAEAERSRADAQAEKLRHELYAAQIARVQRVLDSGGSEAVKAVLASCDPELRGWEWDRLNWLSDRSKRTLRVHEGDHEGIVLYSPDGGRFLTTDNAGRVTVWDSESFQRLLEIPVAPSADGIALTSAAFSADGSLIAAGTTGGTVGVYDASSGAMLKSFRTEDSRVRSVAIDPTGAYVVAGSWLGPTLVWSLQTGERLLTLGDRAERGEVLRFTPDGSRLLIGSLANWVSLVEIPTGRVALSERGSSFVVWDADLSPDSTAIASVGQDARIWMRNAATGRLKYAVSAGKGDPRALAFHPGGDVLAVAGGDGLITMYDVENGGRLGSLCGHESPVSSISFHPGGRFVLSYSRNGSVKLWHLGAAQDSVVYNAGVELTAVGFSAGDARLFLGGLNYGVRSVDPRTLAPMSTEPAPVQEIHQMVLSGDGRLIGASGVASLQDREPTAAVYDIEGRALHRWPVCEMPLAVSHDAHHIVSVEEPGVAVVRDTRSGEIVRRVPIGSDRIRCIAFGPGDASVITGGEDGLVRVIDASGVIAQTLRAHGGGVSGLLPLQRDGRLVTCSLKDNSVKVWEWPSGELLFDFDDAQIPVAIAVSPDGSRLVAGGRGMGIPLWDLRTGRRTMTLTGITAQINGVAFSRDGRTVVSCGLDHSVRIWETSAPSQQELEARYTVDAAHRRARNVNLRREEWESR